MVTGLHERTRETKEIKNKIVSKRKIKITALHSAVKTGK